jgi:hypothetical protein
LISKTISEIKQYQNSYQLGMTHSTAKEGIITTISQCSVQHLSTKNNSQLRNTRNEYQVELITPEDNPTSINCAE